MTALRILRRNRTFAAVAVLSLGLALAANTAVFSFVNAIVLKRLPVPGAERLVIVRQQNEMFHIENCCFSYAFFRELRKQDPDFEDIAAAQEVELNLTDRDETERLSAEIVSGNYFRMLGVEAAAGRLLDESDDGAEGAGRVCVISHRLWQERFGGRPDVLGRRVLLNTEPFQIAGVAGRGFSGATLHERRDVFIPASMTGKFLAGPRDALFGWAQLIARLKPGISREGALARLNALGRGIQKVMGPQMSERDAFLLRDGSQGLGARKEQLGRPVLLLLIMVGVVLLVACANLAALLMVRCVDRAREAGVRIALGATRRALMMQFLTESVLLSAAGGALGWPLAQGFIRVLLSFLGPQAGGLGEQVAPDAAVFAFSGGLTLLAGILFGLAPALRAAQTEPLEAIRGAAFGGPGRGLAYRVLIAAQVAMSLALVFSAGLFAQTLRNLRAIDLGFRPENVVLLHLDLGRTSYAEQGAARFFEDLLARARELPETRAASLATISALSGSMASIIVNIPGYVSPNRLRPVTYFTTISSGYFRTLGIPLLAGRDFTPDDRDTTEGAAIVNERFARQFFGGEALGKTFSYGGGRKVRVVGIAGTAKFRYLREDPQPVLYLPVTQWYFPQSLFLQARTAGAPSLMIQRLRALVREMDPRVPIGQITTMEMQIEEVLGRERLLAFLSTLLAVLTLALVSIGLYGVLSYSVARRTREIGVRMALGAPRGRILMLYLRESAWIALAGIGTGVPLALACGRLASSLLYGLRPQDITTTAAAALLLSVVCLTASLVPAWRATRVDPVAALRHE